MYAGVTQVFDNPTFMHKEGLVSSTVVDSLPGRRFRYRICRCDYGKLTDADRLSKLTEEIARVVQNTETYVHLEPMRSCKSGTCRCRSENDGARHRNGAETVRHGRSLERRLV